jgi:hypothetical protein
MSLWANSILGDLIALMCAIASVILKGPDCEVADGIGDALHTAVVLVSGRNTEKVVVWSQEIDAADLPSIALRAQPIVGSTGGVVSCCWYCGLGNY